MRSERERRTHATRKGTCWVLLTRFALAFARLACESIRFFRLRLLVSPAEKNRYFSEEEKRRPEMRLRFAGYRSPEKREKITLVM